jgi:hypothetical protein
LISRSRQKNKKEKKTLNGTTTSLSLIADTWRAVRGAIVSGGHHQPTTPTTPVRWAQN